MRRRDLSSRQTMQYCDFARLHPAAVGVRARRRHHLVPLEKFRLRHFGARLEESSERFPMARPMGRRARESGCDKNSASNLSFVNYLSSPIRTPIRSSEFSVSDLSSFGEEESSIPVQASAALGLRRWKASSVGLVQ